MLEAKHRLALVVVPQVVVPQGMQHQGICQFAMLAGPQIHMARVPQGVLLLRTVVHHQRQIMDCHHRHLTGATKPNPLILQYRWVLLRE